MFSKAPSRPTTVPMRKPLRLPILCISREAGIPLLMVPSRFNDRGNVAHAGFSAMRCPTKAATETVRLAEVPDSAKQSPNQPMVGGIPSNHLCKNKFNSKKILILK